MCEMCGRAGGLVSADVEGVELKVCQNCFDYGQDKCAIYFLDTTYSFLVPFQGAK